MNASDGQQLVASELSRVAGEIAAVVSERWGRGPRKARAYWAGEGILMVMLEDGHTPAEKTLRAAGHLQEVASGRRMLQRLVEDDLRAIVEDITGRKVAAMLSATRLDPDLSAEIFVMADEPHFQHAMPEPERAEGEEPIESARRVGEEARALQDESRALSAESRQIRSTLARRRKASG